MKLEGVRDSIVVVPGSSQVTGYARSQTGLTESSGC
jgi:hypothetical protein